MTQLLQILQNQGWRFASSFRWLVLDCWSENPEHYRAGKVVSVLILVGFLVYVSWISLNFYTYHRLYTDSGVFAAVSHHVIEGKILYKEVWDHKPPMVYLLNMIPLLADDGSVLAIRFYERFYSVVGCVALFFVVLMALKNPLLAFCTSLGFHWHFYHPEIFQGGNLTEEYAAIFMLMGLFGLFVSQASSRKLSWGFVFLAEMFFSLAVFCKETFLLSTLPWLVYIYYCSNYRDPSRGKSRGIYLAGAFFPAFVFFLLALQQENFGDWLDVLAFNVEYARHSRQSLSLGSSLFAHLQVITRYVARQTVTFHLFFLVGLLGCCSLSFVRKYRYFPWFCLAALGFDFWATRLSEYEIGHYYLQIVTSYLLIAAVGGAFLLHLLSFSRWMRGSVLVGAILLLVLFDSKPLALYIQRLSVSEGSPPIGSISKAILDRKQDGDTLWAGRGENAKCYQETKLLSPSKYIYVYDHLFIPILLGSGEEKKASLTRDILHHPPTFMILSPKDFEHFRTIGLRELMDWVERNYRMVYAALDEENRLYQYGKPPVSSEASR